MGGKHIRKRKRIFLCIACLIFFQLSGCATLIKLEKKHKAMDLLGQGRRAMAGGDFTGAVRENENVLAMFDNERPGDQALYNLGLIYTHPGNPDRDYRKALLYFSILSEEYPESPLAAESAIWAGLLKKITERDIKTETQVVTTPAEDEYFIRSEKMLSRGDYQGSLKENMKVLAAYDKAPPADRALFNIGLIYAHFGNPEKDYRESSRNFGKLVQKYPQSPLAEQARIWIDVLNVIEKAKQVDIEIEKKKKEMTR